MKKLKKLFNKYITNDFRLALFIVIIWKLVMILVGFFIDTSLNNQPEILDHTNHWDAGWYKYIIGGGYEQNPSTPAFYPLFPLLVYLINLLSLQVIGVLLAGQIISFVSTFFIIFGLLKISSHFKINKPMILIAIVLSSPAAFFLHVFYSESLFFAIGLWAYIFSIDRKWLKMGILLGILTACRLPSLLFIGLCGLEFLSAYKWKIREAINCKMFAFLLAPIGFVAYFIFLKSKTGDGLAMFHAYQTNEWTYQIFNPNFVETFLKNAYQIIRSLLGLRPINIELLVNIYLPISMLALIAVSGIYLFVKRNRNVHYLPLAIFSLASFVMFTLNSNVISAHRYALPIISIYIFLYMIAKGKKQILYLAPIYSIGLCIQFLLYTLFIANIFAG